MELNKFPKLEELRVTGAVYVLWRLLLRLVLRLVLRLLWLLLLLLLLSLLLSVLLCELLSVYLYLRAPFVTVGENGLAVEPVKLGLMVLPVLLGYDPCLWAPPPGLTTSPRDPLGEPTRPSVPPRAPEEAPLTAEAVLVAVAAVGDVTFISAD